MLTMNRSRYAQAVRLRKENGLTLIIVMIVMVAMTLAGLAMIHSVNSAGLIAGNMAFRQAALRAGDMGVEAAVTWLGTNDVGTALDANVPTSGYLAAQQDPASGQTWDKYWRTTLDPNPPERPVANKVNSGKVVTLATNSANSTTVSYVIHRLCTKAGDPVTDPTVICASSPKSAGGDDSHDPSIVLPDRKVPRYYRITSRIEGPRNTVSYVQTIVAR